MTTIVRRPFRMFHWNFSLNSSLDWSFGFNSRSSLFQNQVLEVGSGPFCLLSRMAVQSGARQVLGLELSSDLWAHSVDLLRRELRGEVPSCVASFPVVRPGLVALERSVEAGPTYTVTLSGDFKSELTLQHGSSFSLTSVDHDLVIHELLGHVASSEGVIEAITDLIGKGPGCSFIPCAAGTLFAPTARLQLSALEQVLQTAFNGETGIWTNTKYHTRCFDPVYLMAAPQPFEWLEFNSDLKSEQEREVVFVTEKPGFFDGLHFHLHVKLDELTSIDTLSSETTWSTTYVKLLEDSLWLPAGQRIACRCKAWSRGSRGSMRCYSVRVCLGETEVATFHWEGCT